MKKLIVFLSLILGAATLFLYVNHVRLHQAVSHRDGTEGQNVILPEDLEAKLLSKEKAFVYFYSPDCSVCQETTPFLSTLAKQKNIELLKLNILEYEEEGDRNQIEYTPTLVYYEQGKEIDRLEGGLRIVNGKPDAASEKTFSDFFDKYKGA